MVKLKNSSVQGCRHNYCQSLVGCLLADCQLLVSQMFANSQSTSLWQVNFKNSLPALQWYMCHLQVFTNWINEFLVCRSSRHLWIRSGQVPMWLQQDAEVRPCCWFSLECQEIISSLVHSKGNSRVTPVRWMFWYSDDSPVCNNDSEVCNLHSGKTSLDVCTHGHPVFPSLKWIEDNVNLKIM